MLDGLFDLFSTIGEYISTAWTFLVDFFKDTFDMIKLVGETVSKLPQYFTWLPEELLSILLVLFGVVVLYKILGREG